MVTKLTNVNLEKLQDCVADVLLNKNLTNISPSNMYEILFDCESFSKIFNIVLEKLKQSVDKEFDVYVKNMWGYVQDETRKESIDFKRPFKDQLTILPNYSFIYLIDSLETDIHLSEDTELNKQITLSQGELLIFQTKDFIKEECTSKSRIALIGSIALIGDNVQPVKKGLI